MSGVNIKQKDRWLLLSLVLVVFGFLTIMFKPIPVEAKKAIHSAPKSKIISEDKGYRIDSKYEFIPEFTSRTKLEVSGPRSYEKLLYRTNSGGSNSFYTRGFDIGASNSQYNQARKDIRAGKYKARYTNVGKVNGQDVDLLITLKDIDNYGNIGSPPRTKLPGGTYGPLANISFSTIDIDVVMQGLNYMDMDWKIVKSGSNSGVNVSGYYTFDDIDAYQYVGIKNSTWSNHLDKVLLTNNSNRLYYKNASGHHIFSDKSGVDVPDDDGYYDHKYAFTMLYSDTDSISIRWGQDYSESAKNDPRVNRNRYLYNVSQAGGDLLRYTAIKPVPTLVSDPKKNQEFSGKIQHNRTVKYDVSQKVPFEHERFWYKSFELRDKLDSVYQIKEKDLRVYDVNGKNVTSEFDMKVSHSNNTVRAIAKDTKRKSFYNNDYRLRIVVTLNAERLNQKRGSDKNYQIKNTGESRVDGKKRDTPTTKIDVPRRTVTVKHIDDKGNEIHKPEKLYSVDGLKYSVKPRTNLKNSRGHTYRHIDTKGKTSGTVNGNHEVTFIYDEPREITVEHRTLTGRDGNKKLGTDTIWEYDGKTITAKAKHKHFKVTDDELNNGYYYRPRQDKIEHKVNGKGTVILRYDTPRTVTVRHLDKDDGKLLRTTYNKGLYDGETYTAKTLVERLTDKDNYYYRAVDPDNRVGVVDYNMTIDIDYERPRIIEMLHKDNDSKDLITTDIHDKRVYDKNKNYPEETYSYEIYSRAEEELEYHHEENDTKYYYYPLNPYKDTKRARQTGHVIEKEVDKKRNTYTLEFFYTKPALDLGLTYIRIDTDRANDGLPTKLEFDQQIIVPERWKDNDVTLTVYDRDRNLQVYQDDKVDVEKLDKGVEIEVDAKHRKKGSSAIYEAVITTNDKQEVVSGYATSAGIDTNAYVASERVVKAESVEDESTTVKYSGVAMTERHLGEDVKEYKERMTGTIGKTVDLISGYGFEATQEMTFETEVEDHEVPKIKADAKVHTDISDGDYELKDGRHVFKLDSDDKKEDLSRETKFNMPKTYVDRLSGDVSLDKDKFENPKDGGRKVYVPIWIDELGTYKYSVHSNRLGRNHVKFDLDQDVIVDAYMFGHIDSETLDDDALLIEPAKKSMLDRLFGE